MKKLNIKMLFLALLFTAVSIPHATAGEGDRHIGVQTGVMYPRIFNVTLSYDKESSYHNSWEVYLDYAAQWKKCNICDKVCKDSFWKNRYSFAVGAAYKPTVHRGKNQVGRFRIGGDLGTNTRGFAMGVEIGYEYIWALKCGVQLVAQQKNEITFWGKPTFKNGLLVGVRIPL